MPYSFPMAVNGRGIDDIRLAKKTRALPGQRCSRFDVSQVNYTFKVQAMSTEKLPFVLLAGFTIGPRVDDMYPKLKLSNHVTYKHVQGVIYRETRVLAASMTMEEIFKGTNEFKKALFEKVQLELNQFGHLIYYANIEQLGRQKTQMEVANHQAEATSTTAMASDFEFQKMFRKTLSRSDINDGKVYIGRSQDAAAILGLPYGADQVIHFFDDRANNTWRMRFFTNRGRAYFGSTWRQFVIAKRLRAGDTVIFSDSGRRGTVERLFKIARTGLAIDLNEPPLENEGDEAARTGLGIDLNEPPLEN